MDENEIEGQNFDGENVSGCLAGAGDAPPVNTEDQRQEVSTEEIVIHPFVKALQCDLVAEKLLSLINFEDIKALSTVSTGCLDAVRKTDEFSKRARFIVCKEVVTAGILKESVHQWKNLSLDLSLPVEVVDLIEDILERVTCLSLQSPDTKDDRAIVHYLSEIFKKSPNLHTLELDASIFNHVLHDLFSNVGVQTLFTNLHCLAIQSQCNKPNSVCYIDGAEDDTDIPFQRNFLQLSMVPLQLKKFVFGRVLTITGSETEHVKFIPRIVQAVKNTLEDLELHLNVWKFEELNAIRCPKLKRLVLSANGNEEAANIVQTFLKNQPPLEELVISLNTEFPFSILQVLQGVLTKMKKLHLKAKKFSGTTTPVDWQFLGSMNALKDFRIRKPASILNNADNAVEIYGYGEDILKKLPDHIQKISLQGFDPFWIDQYPVTGNIGELLNRFKNLTEINLLRSTNALTDEGLQSIIDNCKRLTALTFSHCPEVTDFGISGIRKNEESGTEEKVGVSLKDLKGLIRLKIRSCPNISSDCLLSVVEFPFLRYFDYYRNVQLPKTFLFQIARQNPCLEEVSLHITSYENDSEYMNALTREVKEINPRLHLMEILEQSNWEDVDSDSDASSFHADGDSDFSGGGYPNYDFDNYDDEDYDSPYDFDDEYDEDDGLDFY